MARQIRGHVVVITGASSGVGRACAQAFGARGARVALLARNEEALSAAAEEILKRGGEALVHRVDMADASAVDAAAKAVVDRFGQIDTWVNCAMLTVFAPVMRMTPEEYRRVTDVAYLGYVHGTQTALRHMLSRGEGTIIQIGSALAYRSIPLQSAYCAAKAAVRAFTDSLRTELIHERSNVQLTQLHLPAVNTPQATRQRNKLPQQAQPVPPMFSPESIAEMVVWAAEQPHPPREVLVGRPTVQAVWGQKFIPGVLDWYLGRTGWQAQMIDRPNEQNGRDILFETLPGDPGAHGPYREQERGPDWQMRLRTRPRAALACGVLLAIGALTLLRRTARAAPHRTTWRIRHVPEPDLPGLDADTVDGSAEVKQRRHRRQHPARAADSAQQGENWIPREAREG